VTISRGFSFSDLKRVPVIVDARAAADAVETLIRNSWTHSNIFVIEEVKRELRRGSKSSASGRRSF